MGAAGTVPGIVYNAAQFMTPEGVKLTGCGNVLFSGLNLVHRGWRLWKYSQTYNPSNALPLLAGHGLNFATQEPSLRNTVIRVGAFWLMVIHRISLYVEQTITFSRTVRQLADAIYGRYQHHEQIAWIKPSDTKGFSPSTVYWAKTNWHAFSTRVSRIMINTLCVIKEFSVMSMRFLDILEMFPLFNKYISGRSGSSIRDEAVSHLFVNTMESIDSMVNNQAEMLLLLKRNKPVIQKMLGGINATYAVDKLEEVVAASLNTAKTTQTVLRAGGGAVESLAKEIVFTAASFVGVTSWLPTGVRPDPIGPWKDAPLPPRVYAWPMMNDTTKSVSVVVQASPIRMNTLVAV